MPIIRVSGFIEGKDYETYQKLKRLLESFAEENKFTFMDVQFEEKVKVTGKT
jgi:hypothetical protein